MFAFAGARDACDADQFVRQPCRCCKMDCWYNVAGSAAHELGHMPGQEGEQEALATLRLIRACMIAECSPVCPASGPQHSPLAAMLIKRRQLQQRARRR